MDELWRENEKAVKKMKWCSLDTCITSWNGRENVNETVYESTEKVWETVRVPCRPIPWFMPPEWPNKARKEVIDYLVGYKSCSL